jgi:tRNA(Arg) A34 adenosine deaminase TadA
MDKKVAEYMEEALFLARDNMNSLKGGPFGAVIVRNGEVIARGTNKVITENDPTCHAEVVAIREACRVTGSYHLQGCTIYSSCEPCPMCLGAIYWAHLDKLYFAAGKKDAAKAGFADDLIYQEIQRHHIDRKIQAEQIMREEAIKIFDRWIELDTDIVY